jgi:hypothetical protein
MRPDIATNKFLLMFFPGNFLQPPFSLDFLKPQGQHNCKVEPQRTRLSMIKKPQSQCLGKIEPQRTRLRMIEEPQRQHLRMIELQRTRLRMIKPQKTHLRMIKPLRRCLGMIKPQMTMPPHDQTTNDDSSKRSNRKDIAFERSNRKGDAST